MSGSIIIIARAAGNQWGRGPTFGMAFEQLARTIPVETINRDYEVWASADPHARVDLLGVVESHGFACKVVTVINGQNL